VVRDLSRERGKQVRLVVQGEKTELDKRMIDALGDPLVHLIRNAIDHGLEPADVRREKGKVEIGTIVLEAMHRGNNVFMYVRDDGRGIDTGRIREKLVDRGLLSRQQADQLDDEQAIEYIWHPGFSTAGVVSDISGRGVGMDVVRNRITSLNGTVEVQSTPGEGTTFALRLPLTLAIIQSLLVRMRGTVFSIPIDDVREIVSLRQQDILTVHSQQTFDLRGEFVSLASLDGVFQWRLDRDASAARPAIRVPRQAIRVVVLQAGGRMLGLRVDELIGSQDVVIKSLSDNFIHIRGLSGASILGDGSVCLMLDVGSLIEMFAKAACGTESREITRD
jgi:two-component system chemotaxis sensor kinase CheA